MKALLAALTATLALTAQALAADSVTTHLDGPNGTATITQSGDPATASTTVEQRDGQTTIRRNSGGNSLVIIQGKGGGALPRDPAAPRPAVPDASEAASDRPQAATDADDPLADLPADVQRMMTPEFRAALPQAFQRRLRDAWPKAR